MIRGFATIALAFAATAALAADPTLLNMVMPDAKVISGIHVGQTLASPFGRHVLGQMQTTDANFEKFMADTGFDPRRDLSEVLFASNDQPNAGKHGAGLVIAQGVFDVSRILAKAKVEGATITSYNGADVFFKNENGNVDGWIAFLDGNTALGGSSQFVKAAIDHRRSGSGLDPKLITKINDLSNRNDAWFVSAVPISQMTPPIPNDQMKGAFNGDLLKSIQQASGGVKFGLTVQINGEAVTRSDKDASALADVVRFLSSMVQLNRNDPNADKLATLLDTMVLTTDSNVMKLSLSIAESDLEQIIPQHHKANVKKAALRH